MLLAKPVLSHFKGTTRGQPAKPISPSTGLCDCSLNNCTRPCQFTRDVMTYVRERLVTDTALTHSPLVTTNLVHSSLVASTRQPVRYATVHSTMRPFSHSSADRNILDNGPTRSLLLSSTMISSNLSPPRRPDDFLGPRTLPLCRQCRPHLHCAPRPSRQS